MLANLQQSFPILDPALINERWLVKSNVINIGNVIVPVADANPRRVLLSFHNASNSVNITVGLTDDVQTQLGWQVGGNSLTLDVSFSYALFGGLVGQAWRAFNAGAIGQDLLIVELIYLPLGN